MPNILHLSTGKTLRGGENQLILLHNELLARNIQSYLVCKKNSNLHKVNPKNTIPLSWQGELDVFALFSFVAHCKTLKPSIVHCHDAHALSLACMAKPFCSFKIIYTRRVVFRINASVFTKMKYRACNAVIAISKAVADQCSSVVAESKVRTIGDSVDLSVQLLSAQEARKALSVSAGDFVIGSVAHFTSEKNLDLLIKTAEFLLEKYPKVKIVCIGPIQDNSIRFPGNIISVGHLPNAMKYYNAFDAYISTSTCEGLGSALLDAVVRSIPSVSLNAGGTVDIYPFGWPIIPQGNEMDFILAVKQTVDNFSQAKIDAERAAIRAQEVFSLKNVTDKTLSLYNSLL